MHFFTIKIKAFIGCKNCIILKNMFNFISQFQALYKEVQASFYRIQKYHYSFEIFNIFLKVSNTNV